ncbi:hypothetical protein [Intestinibacillus massiliensis]|uniref:hypothetical protein n=1 Tax=Intestinibacillus massiliensis TaxID=1871029 RepID=UPI000B364AFA|nr:hypothetical protein [Intestinibacillus massiliensis]
MGELSQLLFILTEPDEKKRNKSIKKLSKKDLKYLLKVTMNYVSAHDPKLSELRPPVKVKPEPDDKK